MNEVVLEKRKIIRQGQYSRIVVLPSGFCEMHGWDYGKEVIIKTDGNRLILELVEE
jgi:hypothetical protein